MKATSVQRLLDLVEITLANANLRASYVQRRDEPFALPGVPIRDGVQVDFDRLLPPDGQKAFNQAMQTKLPHAQWLLGPELGTAVVVAVPIEATSPCWRGAEDEGLHLLEPDVRRIGDILPFFGPGTSGGAATVTYIGPARTRAQLHAVAGAVAHSCSARAGGVTFTRAVAPDEQPAPPG